MFWEWLGVLGSSHGEEVLVLVNTHNWLVLVKCIVCFKFVAVVAVCAMFVGPQLSAFRHIGRWHGIQWKKTGLAQRSCVLRERLRYKRVDKRAGLNPSTWTLTLPHPVSPTNVHSHGHHAYPAHHHYLHHPPITLPISISSICCSRVSYHHQFSI